MKYPDDFVNKILVGDCIEVMKTMPDNCVDAIVSDIPAGISFMGKSWDTFDKSMFGKKGAEGANNLKVKKNFNILPRYANADLLGFQDFVCAAFTEAIRVLKPGGHCLVWAIPRTSHHTAMGLERAGFEIRDIVHHINSQGFPKSMDISKQIDKMSGAERKVVGINKGGGMAINTPDGVFRDDNWTPESKDLPITEPATPDAKKWSGWGTALKPACEHWILAYKPLTFSKECAIMDSIENNLRGLLWQSLKKSTDKDTFKLLEMGLIPLSIVLLWHNILGEFLRSENKSIISMESKLITKLKILNSLLLKNMQDDMVGKSQIFRNGMSESRTNGLNVFVNIAEKVLVGKNLIKNDLEITTLIATEIATLKTKNIGLNVQNVKKDLEMLNTIVSSVLQNVLIDLIDENNKERLYTLVMFAEKLLQLSLAENQNTVEENVWQKHLENLIPNMSHWILCRKPLSEKSIVENVLKHGTGGINVDGCRVEYGNESDKRIGTDFVSRDGDASNNANDNQVPNEHYVQMYKATGRFPANLSLECTCDEVIIEGQSKPPYKYNKNYNEKGFLPNVNATAPYNYNDRGKLIIHTNPECPCYIMDRQSGKLKSGDNCTRQQEGHFGEHGGLGNAGDVQTTYGDMGGASRFFYCAKASTAERNKGLDGGGGSNSYNRKCLTCGKWERKQGLSDKYTCHCENPKWDEPSGNNHPTVKSLELMRYLVRLITPKDGIVLDPFAGSGSTLIAAKLEGFKFIGIEKELDYVKIAQARLKAWHREPELFNE